MTADPTRTLPPEYYVRQLHDMKYGIDIGGLRPPGMRLYAEVCAWALARAHARSGNPAEIAGYLWQGDVFDEAIASFAVAYVDQTERTTPLSSPRSVRAGWPARPASERAAGTLVVLPAEPSVPSVEPDHDEKRRHQGHRQQ